MTTQSAPGAGVTQLTLVGVDLPEPAPAPPEKKKQLYVVNIAQEIVVLADDPEDAMRVAEDNIGDLDWHNTAERGVPFAYYPGDWEPNAMPFEDPDPPPGAPGRPELTIGKLIAQGHAPAYKLPASTPTTPRPARTALPDPPTSGDTPDPPKETP